MGLRAHCALLLLTVLAVGCDSSETPAPSPSPLPKVVPAVVPSVVPPVVPVVSGAFDPNQLLTGTWKGLLRQTQPAGTSDYYICPFELRIEGAPDAYSGRLQIFHSGLGWTSMDANIRGSTRPDGFAAFTGSGTYGPSFSVEVTDLAVRTHVQSGLAGRMNVQTRAQPSGYAFEIISATWEELHSAAPPVSPGAFQGVWRGPLRVTSCTGICYLYPVSRSMTIDLAISQVGSALTSSYPPISTGPLTGDATGTTFVLRRNYERPNGCPASAYDDYVVCKESIEITGTLRSDGKLQAVVQEHREAVTYSSREVFDATFDLLAVAR